MLVIGDIVKIQGGENILGPIHEIRGDDGAETAVILIARNGKVHRFEINVSMLEKVTGVDEYVQAIKKVQIMAGLEAANVANHKALETRKISLEQFQAAARVLAREILKR